MVSRKSSTFDVAVWERIVRGAEIGWLAAMAGSPLVLASLALHWKVGHALLIAFIVACLAGLIGFAVRLKVASWAKQASWAEVAESMGSLTRSDLKRAVVYSLTRRTDLEGFRVLTDRQKIRLRITLEEFASHYRSDARFTRLLNIL